MRKGFFFPVGTSLKNSKKAYITQALVIINVVAFFISLMDYENIIFTYGFIPSLFTPISLITSMFLHGDLWHIFGNMLYLWIFGKNVEDYYGRKFYLPFYILTGIIASLIHFISDSSSIIPAIGASGAISGIQGAYLVLFPDSKIKVLTRFGIQHISAKAVIGLWFIFQLIYALSSLTGFEAGIAFWAHVGGFIGGWVITKQAIKKKKVKRKRQNYYVQFYNQGYY